eukprot:882080-Prymnesium_polylepis.1
MEMIPDENATKDTHRMLLDTFMNGFVFKLYMAKWMQWARYFWMLDAALLAGLAVFLSILASPTLLGYGESAVAVINSRTLPFITLMLTIIYFVEQMLDLIGNVRADQKKLMMQGGLLTKFNNWVTERLDNWLLVASSSVSCLSVLMASDPADAHAEAGVRILLALAQLMTWYQVFINCFVPFEQFGIFVIVVRRMAGTDMI